MTYDIALLPRRPGQDWFEALDAAMRVEVKDRTELLKVWSRIEARLREVLSGEIDVRRHAPNSTSLIVAGLTSDDGLEVGLYPGQASVSFPKREQGDPGGLHRQVTEVVRIVAEETGYAAFDPQKESDFDGTFGEESGPASTDRLRGQHANRARAESRNVTPPIEPVPEANAQQRDAYTEEPRPGDKDRRRSTGYLIIGAGITVLALWLIVTGRGTTMTWVVLAFGVLDIVLAAYYWTVANRADAEHGS
ncbi:MAG TPA: hypothetical protein VFC82_09845 [Actinomycetaceae bacterium]|nr:hypothetical protein [Actinomycetaceae bacterium]